MQKQDNFCQKKYQKTLHINAQTNRPVASGGGPARLALRFAALIVIWGRNLHHRLIEVRELKCFFHDLSPLRCKYPVHYATRCAFVCVCTCVRACECVCVYVCTRVRVLLMKSFLEFDHSTYGKLIPSIDPYSPQ